MGCGSATGCSPPAVRPCHRAGYRPILIHQPVAWRLFGWAQVRMNVAGYAGNANSKSTMLLPVADLGLHPGAGGLAVRREWTSPPFPWTARRPGPRPGRRCGGGPSWPVRTNTSWWPGTGLFSRTIDIVPHERTQSVRLTSGPWQRVLGLATVHLDSTRGPVRTRAANRDRTVARAMLDRQVERAHQARLRAWEPTAAPPR